MLTKGFFKRVVKRHLLCNPHVLCRKKRAPHDVTTRPVYGVGCYSIWETSHIYLTVIWNIIGMIYLINKNNIFNLYIDKNNASLYL